MAIIISRLALGLVILSFFGCITKHSHEIEIISGFDHGSVGSLKMVDDSTFSGQTMHWIKNDQIGNQYYWFYYQVDNAQNERIYFEFKNLVGTYRGNPHALYSNNTYPVISYDRVTWKRIRDVEYDEENKRFSFNYKFTEDKAWIAYAHPYSLSRKEKFLKRISDSDQVKIDTIGFSRENRPIEMMTIPSDGNPNKLKTLLILSLQHSGEDCVGFMVEGLVDFILSDHLKAMEFKENFMLKIVPMMNPDGIYHGTSRYNWAMEDLNSEWDDNISDTSNLPVEPEVMAVKNWYTDWITGGNKLNMMIDCHSHSQKDTKNVLIIPSKEFSPLVLKIDNYFKIEEYIGGSTNAATGHFYHNLQIPSSTLELTQSHTGDGNYLTIDDYRSYGRGLLFGIWDFFRQYEEE